MNTGAGGARPGFFANMFGGGQQEPAAPEPNQVPAAGVQPQEIPNENQLDFERQNQVDENGDPSRILNAFFTDEEDDSNDDDNDDDDNNPPAPKLDANGNPLPTPQEQSIMKGIADLMKGLTPPEDLMGDDFNPNDPKAMRGMLAKVQQQTAQATLQMMLIPMKEAMTTLQTDLKADFAQQLQQFGGQSDAKAVLARIVPEVRGEHAGMVNTLYTQAMKKKGATPEKAAGAVRTALDALGIRSSNQAAPTDPSSGVSKRTGSDALNIYAPLK